MRYLFIFALALTAWSQSAILEWQYSSNTIWSAQQMGQPFWFKLYGTNQLGSPAANWQLVVAQPATNFTVVNYDGTNNTYAYTSPIAPGQFFYTATASNFWGETGFSNTSGVPTLPSVLHTTIQKGL